MKVFADKLGYEQRKFMNFKNMWFPWKPVEFQLGTISETARIQKVRNLISRNTGSVGT